MLKDIFEAETNKKERENKKLLGHFFSKSMIEDRVDFVAFLADKIDLKTYLTKVNQTKNWQFKILNHNLISWFFQTIQFFVFVKIWRPILMHINREFLDLQNFSFLPKTDSFWKTWNLRQNFFRRCHLAGKLIMRALDYIRISRGTKVFKSLWDWNFIVPVEL